MLGWNGRPMEPLLARHNLGWNSGAGYIIYTEARQYYQERKRLRNMGSQPVERKGGTFVAFRTAGLKGSEFTQKTYSSPKKGVDDGGLVEKRPWPSWG